MQQVGPLGSTLAFRHITGSGTQGVATAYGNAFSYAANASAIAAVRRGSAVDPSYVTPMTLDCDEKCKYLPASEAEACSQVCDVLRY